MRTTAVTLLRKML